MFVENDGVEAKSNTIHNSEHNMVETKEPDLLKPEDKIEPKKKTVVSFIKLEFALANKCDIALICCACLGSLIAGAGMPLISLLLGRIINNFNASIPVDQVPALVQGLIINFIIAGLAIFVGSFMMTFFWTLSGRRLINKINEDYFRVIMRQEQGWFDQSNMFEFATKVQSQIKAIEAGVIYYL